MAVDPLGDGEHTRRVPIYEYQCECGERLESIERVGTTRATCDGICPHDPPRAGKVERVFSTGQLRGTGHEAKEPTVDLKKRSGRHWDDCC